MSSFPWVHELLAATLISAGFLSVFGLAEAWRHWGRPPVEWTRKLVHVLGGLITASFPWVFDSRWTVVGLAALFLLSIWGSRRLGLLPSVHGVERRSEGGLYFPLGVLVVFLVGYHRPIFYLIAVLALVISDSAAALAGRTYGKQVYTVESDRRSLEGSVVFLVTTFLVVHLPLLLMEGLEPAASVLIGTQIAIIVTQFEIISLRGNDNLLVPIATYYLLIKMTPHGPEHIAEELVAQLVIIALIGLAAWRSRALTFSGATVLMLFAYGAYGLGGWEWVTAPGLALVAFLLARRFLPSAGGPQQPQYQVVAGFYVCIVATVVLIANNSLETLIPGVPETLRFSDPLYPPFVGIVAAQIALIVMAQLHPFEPGGRFWRPRTFRSVAGAIVLVVPAGLAVGQRGITPAGVVVAGLTPLIAALVYLWVRRSPAWPHESPWNVRLQALSAALAALVVVPIQLWWFGRG